MSSPAPAAASALRSRRSSPRAGIASSSPPAASDELDRLAKALGPHAFPVVTDVTVRAEVEHLRDRAIERFGEIDVWINNAGRGLSKFVAEVTDDELDQMMTVNVKSALYGIQAILPHFKARGAGQIINVSSFLSRVPMASIRSAYSASKAALNSLTANLRMDLAATRSRHPRDAGDARPGLDRIRPARRARHAADPPRRRRRRRAERGRSRRGDRPASIDQPVAEVFTNPALAGIARKYFEDVGGLRGREMRRRRVYS